VETEVKTGIVIEASMHALSIEAPDGTTYTFVTDDSTEFIGEGETLGDTVSVEYEGEYEQNILAIRIKAVEKAHEETVTSVPEATAAPT